MLILFRTWLKRYSASVPQCTPVHTFFNSWIVQSHKWVTSEFFILFRTLVGNTIEINLNAGTPLYPNVLVVPTQNWKKRINCQPFMPMCVAWRDQRLLKGCKGDVADDTSLLESIIGREAPTSAVCADWWDARVAVDASPCEALLSTW